MNPKIADDFVKRTGQPMASLPESILAIYSGDTSSQTLIYGPKKVAAIKEALALARTDNYWIVVPKIGQPSEGIKANIICLRESSILVVGFFDTNRKSCAEVSKEVDVGIRITEIQFDEIMFIRLVTKMPDLDVVIELF
jgi:hypothetical protein